MMHQRAMLIDQIINRTGDVTRLENVRHLEAAFTDVEGGDEGGAAWGDCADGADNKADLYSSDLGVSAATDFNNQVLPSVENKESTLGECVCEHPDLRSPDPNTNGAPPTPPQCAVCVGVTPRPTPPCGALTRARGAGARSASTRTRTWARRWLGY